MTKEDFREYLATDRSVSFMEWISQRLPERKDVRQFARFTEGSRHDTADCFA